MIADGSHEERFYRTRQQGVMGWVLAAITTGGSIVVLLLPTEGRHGGYVLAPIGLVLAAGMIRFARSGVFATPDGVRVRGMFKTTALAWDEIKEFKLSQYGACLIALNNGKWVSMIGIEQTNRAGMTNRQNTRERQMTMSSTTCCEHTPLAQAGRSSIVHR